MYKEELALNNIQRLLCHKTQPNLKSLIFLSIKKTFKIKSKALKSGWQNGIKPKTNEVYLFPSLVAVSQ